VERFYDKTGCPVIINTSFNVRGEPIVCTPQEAYRCFMATDMDVLVLETCILRKEEQPDAKADRSAYLEQFKLD
jgi:carbamoyltransferase